MYLLILGSLLCVIGAKALPRSLSFCPTTNECSCEFSATNDYDIMCPSNDTSYIINISDDPEYSHGIYVHIQCVKSDVDPFNVIPKCFNMEKVSTLRFYYCPINDTFRNFLNKLGAASVENSVIFHYGKIRLTNDHFRGFNTVKTVQLNDNEIDFLPDDVFFDLVNVSVIDLRVNNISEISGKLFETTVNLEILDVGDNQIVQIDERAFQNLRNLTRLSLWKNRIQKLTTKHLEMLDSLRILDLSNNDISYLDVDLFANLTNLRELNLIKNNVTTLPGALFKYNRLLESILLWENPIESIPDFLFSNLTSLRKISLESCAIVELSSSAFVGLHSLDTLSLANNFIESLPTDVFKDLKSLRILDLTRNNLTVIDDGVFRHLGDLKILKLDENAITTITEAMFENLASLEHLQMDNNQLKHIHQMAFYKLDKLKIISMDHNELTLQERLNNALYENISPFQTQKNLEQLYLAHNHISVIFDDWRQGLLNLREIDLSYNNFTYVEFSGSLHFLAHNLRLVLSHNNISIIDLVYAEAFVQTLDVPDAHSGITKSTKVLIDGNPITCDCNNYYFFKYLEGATEPALLALVEIIPGTTTCANPVEMRGKHLSDVSSKEAVCEIRAGTNHVACPDYCRCTISHFDRSLTVDCSAQELTDVPTTLPQNNFFNNTVVNLSDNNLTSFDYQFNYKNVSKLILDYNNISSITWLPEHLVALSLINNSLTHIDVQLLNASSSGKNARTLKMLHLEENPWKCDCNATMFLNYIQVNFDIVQNINEIRCEDARVLHQLTNSDLCPVVSRASLAIAVVVALSIVIIVLLVLYYNYEQSIKVWLYAHHLCLWWVTEAELDRDKQYDAFVSYSHLDEDFVVNELMPNLESCEPPFKLCIHFRDFRAGEFIPDQIARAVESSRRTLVVLSPHFLNSVWGKMEFRSAHLNSLQEGCSRVIIIKYKDVGKVDNLEPELRAYLTLNTYIEWGDKMFWDKLRYALPHSAKLSKKGKLLSQHIKHSLSDKIELIKPKSIVEPCSTPPIVDDHDDMSKVPINF